MSTPACDRVGIVVIGRNEGERLKRCLQSVRGRAAVTVYVDSGSTDGSVEFARSLGVEVMSLDTSRGFTMARGRNAGFDRLVSLRPDLPYVQFVDGDCEVVPGWIETAAAVLDEQSGAGVVCGRRRERFPQSSVYNHLTDMEWAASPGEARSCGGDAMMRVEVLRSVGLFNPELIAGEEPELCVRIRRGGWKILRLDAEMTLHDAAMTRFGQWWKRMTRGGWAYAMGASLYGRDSERLWVRESRSIWFWGALLPLVAVGGAWPTGGWSLLLLLLYPMQVLRVALRRRRAGMQARDAWLYAAAVTVAKWPQFLGQVSYWRQRWAGRAPSLIEYK